jgi:serine/threonine-protein kinase HipA
MKKPKILSVRMSGTPVGQLEQTKEGKLKFQYEDGARQISLSMPLENKRFGNMPCEKYFGGLLPESEETRRAIGRKFDANPKSTFSLLRAIGRDCAGAISFHDPEDPVIEDSFLEIRMQPLSEPQLEKHIKELPLKPLFLGVEGLRLSLAGVQEKAAVCLLDGKIAVPLEGTPTTHILKPTISKFPGSVQNEYLCLRTAASLSLPAPDARMGRAGKEVYLLVERYDRKFKGDKRILRLQQEDFCQALGFREKYQRLGGPGFKDCFELMMKTRIPIIDRDLLMRAAVFNYLVGNNDAHGKNFAILYDVDGNSRLAPFYDILCTQAYDELTNDMCMKVGDHYDFKDITESDWQGLCKVTGFSFPGLKKIVNTTVEQIVVSFEEGREVLRGTEFDDPILDNVVARVRHNAKTLSKMK